METFEVPRHRTRRRGRPSERGYTLAAVLVLVTILAMVLAYTIPDQWSRLMQRERELHTIWVMKQYARAVQEFQKKRGTYPVSLEQLTEQKNPRIIRQLYANPLTGEQDFALVPFGTPTPATNAAAGAVAPGAPQLPQQPTTPQPTTPATGAGGRQVGPFIGVRLAMSGESIVPLNGQTKYEEWVYTVNELQRDQAAVAGGLPVTPGREGDPRNPADPRYRPPQPPPKP